MKTPVWLKAPSVRASTRLVWKGLKWGSPILLLVLAGIGFSRSSLTAPEPTFLLRDRHGRFLGEVNPRGSDGEFGYWPVKELPPRVVAATVAVEDRRFEKHPGIDPFAIGRAFFQNVIRRKRVSGASTLAMQVARMQTPGRRGYFRKAVEALTALFLTVRQGREAVLRQYLTIVPYGNRIHGIDYAARRYLDKPVEDLSWAETAFLTAIPQAPGRMNPFDPQGRKAAIARGKRILRLLRARQALSMEEFDLATSEISRLKVPPQLERPKSALHAVLWFSEQLRDPQTRLRLQRRQILKTTLDLEIQGRVQQLARSSVALWERQGAGNAAAMVVDRATGEVLVSVGSTDYFNEEHAGAIDYTRVPRSPGSALKPFIFALALERGAITAASVLDDLDRGSGGITNSDDLFLGPLLPRVALANSRNVPAADLLDRIGLNGGFDFFRDLGLHRGEQPARRYGLGLAIGGLPVTLERLVTAYTCLAGDGRLRDLVWYDAQPARTPRRLLSEETARLVSLFLSDPMARLPSFPRMGPTEYPFPVAVKTGTSSRYRDAWTVAFSARYLVGVWVGHPDFKPMNRLSGFRSAAELSQKIMTSLHREDLDGLRDVPFPPPSGFRQHRLCPLSGRLATPDCDRVSLEWLAQGQEPVDSCSAHARLAIDIRTGLLASRATPRSRVEVRTFVELPPRYASWTVSAGLQRPPSPSLPGQSTAVRLLQVPSTRAGNTGTLPLSAPTTSRVRVTSPENGVSLLRDPETPPGQATVALRAMADPPVEQLVWYVDGQPFETVDYPYSTRWRVVPGEHTFQARLPYRNVASGAVTISVK